MKFAIARQHQRQQKRFRFKRAQHCYWCGGRLQRRRADGSPMQATREHVLPRSIGGGGGANIVAACRACNNARGNKQGWVPYHVQKANGLFLQRDDQGQSELVKERGIAVPF